VEPDCLPLTFRIIKKVTNELYLYCKTILLVFPIIMMYSDYAHAGTFYSKCNNNLQTIAEAHIFKCEIEVKANKMVPDSLE
jgi:hypothetical protein